MIKCSIRAETDRAVVDNNNLLPQAPLSLKRKVLNAAPQAGYEPKPSLSSLKHGASTR